MMVNNEMCTHWIGLDGTGGEEREREREKKVGDEKIGDLVGRGIAASSKI